MKRENLIIELAAWGLDDNPDRPAAEGTTRAQARAEEGLASLPDWSSRSPRIEALSADIQNALTQNAERDDLREEFHGLAWTLGVVDLRRLVSFQRRLVLNDELIDGREPHDWTARTQVALPRGRNSTFDRAWHTSGVTLTSENPDLTVRWHTTHENDEVFALMVRHGSPFMEVGCYRGRWFLRDGYHRAYRLLRAGIFEIPAVIVQVVTLEELGANQPWFFPEEVLFGRRPPLVTDFLADELVLRWNRPARRKIIRISISEDFELLNSKQEQGAEL
jgi:hypothetical protein